MLRFIQNIIFKVIVYFLFLIFPVFSFTSHAIANDAGTYLKPPGMLVDIGTHKMHLNCQGIYPPTVIIDSGLGGFSLEWTTLQKQLSRYNRVCSYDRSGYGWSEESPNPRTTSVIATELHLLLETAGIEGPYVMVGHSFGGYNIRYFASQYPDQIAGLVFIDASHPEQFERMPGLVSTKENDIKRKGMQIKLAIPRLSNNFPREYLNTAYFLMCNLKARRTQLQELENFKISANQVMANDHLPDVPVIVITHGKRIWPHNEIGDESEQVWQDLQDELAMLGKNSIHLIADKSGHSVHLDQPLLIYTAISDLVKPSYPLQYFDTLYVKN